MTLTKSILFLSIMLCIFIFSGTSEASQTNAPNVEIIVDFTQSMEEEHKGRKKIDIARETATKLLDRIPESSVTGFTLLHNSRKSSCPKSDEVRIEGKYPEHIKKRLREARPKGEAPLSPILIKTAEQLEGNNKSMIIVLITDGKTPCEEDLVKTARELKEKYDYRMRIYIVGMAAGSQDFIKLFRVAAAGYGRHLHVRSLGSINDPVKYIAGEITTYENHVPRDIKDDEMALVPGGEFIMGDGFDEGDPSEVPRHKVSLDAFYMDKYQVTQKQYKSVMGNNPSLWMGSDLPVEMVTWHEAKEYCEKVGKRLPTEAEWEKAAKGGKDQRWAGGNTREEVSEHAWFDDAGARAKTHPVGLKKPNPYGIYDLSGNVWEWTADYFSADYYGKSPGSNPPGPEKGSLRVLRGGCWDSHWRGVRVSKRHTKPPDKKLAENGIRCVKSATK
jgi:formylglycine-generating enzyme required for sulfatase activity